jgi:hypothetical protein
MAHIKL